MDSMKYDGFLFGNGLTVNLFQKLKSKVPKDKKFLLSIDEFLVEISEGKNKEIDNYIFELLYKEDLSNRYNFQKLKQEINRYYVSGGNSNIEYEFGKYLFLKETVAYDYDLMMSLFPYLYNIWYNIVYKYIIDNFEIENIQLDDETAIQMIKKVLGIENLVSIQNLNVNKRNEKIAHVAKIEGIQRKQLARILGVSERLIYRAVKSSKIDTKK